MTPMKPRIAMYPLLQRTLALLACGMLTVPLTGCLVLGGSSRGGFFIFPGSLGLVLLIVIVALLLRRR